MATRLSHSTKIIIVDDHEVVRLGIKNVLDRVPGYHVVGEAATSQESIDLSKKLTPDLLLLDIRLPDEDGFVTCRKVLEVCPECRVLFVSSFVNQDLIQQAVVAGASGYVLKAVGSKNLLDSIAAVLRGERALDLYAMKEVFSWMKGQQEASSDITACLSAQERRTIILVAEGKTNKEIASMLNLSESTIKNYLARIFEKLGVSRRAEAASLATRALLKEE